MVGSLASEARDLLKGVNWSGAGCFASPSQLDELRRSASDGARALMRVFREDLLPSAPEVAFQKNFGASEFIQLTVELGERAGGPEFDAFLAELPVQWFVAVAAAIRAAVPDIGRPVRCLRWLQSIRTSEEQVVAAIAACEAALAVPSVLD